MFLHFAGNRKHINLVLSHLLFANLRNLGSNCDSHLCPIFGSLPRASIFQKSPLLFSLKEFHLCERRCKNHEAQCSESVKESTGEGEIMFVIHLKSRILRPRNTA